MAVNRTLKNFGACLGLAGGIIALFASFSYFLPGNFFSHLDYNRVGSRAGEEITIAGVLIFIIAITSIILSLSAFRSANAKTCFICLILLGAIFLSILIFIGSIYTVFASYIASLAILFGGIFGDLSGVNFVRKIQAKH